MVFIAGMENGLFPHSRSFDEPAEMEEERRLCYVGFTRAEKRLFLTGAVRRRIYGVEQAHPPSLFLADIPSACVQDFSSRPVLGAAEPVAAMAASNGYAPPRAPAATRTPATKPAARQAGASANGPYAVGSQVQHQHFGPGVVQKTRRGRGSTETHGDIPRSRD